MIQHNIVKRSAMRILGIVVATLCAVALMVAPFSPLNQSADAVTPSNPPAPQPWAQNEWKYNSCSFRKGVGDTAVFADELCWIDMSDLLNSDGTPAISGVPKPMEKNLGRYTLKWNVSLVVQEDAQLNKFAVGMSATDARIAKLETDNAWPLIDDSSAFGHTLSGQSYFVPESGDTNKPTVKTIHNSTTGRKFKFVFDKIQLFDNATNQVVGQPRLVVADAQQTAQGTGSEVFTVNDPTAGVTALAGAKFTPANDSKNTYYPACSTQTSTKNIYGPIPAGTTYGLLDTGPSDFGCYEYNGGVVTSLKRAGMFLSPVAGAQTLEISTYSFSTQAWALAIDFGRMRGNVSADTTQEKLATNQETSFDFQMAIRNGTTDTPVPWQGPNTYTQVARTPATNDGSGVQSIDSQVFSSTASGDQASQVFNRYDPVWTCTMATSGTTQTIKAGTTPPAGYTLTNDTTKNKSELVVTNRLNEPISCTVKWTPTFVAANLTLSKSSDGTASSYSEFANKDYSLTYSCVPPHDASQTDQQAIDAFAKTYPTVKLTDTVTVKAGGQKVIQALPAGAKCVVTEGEDAKPGTNSGVDHTLTWTATDSTTNPPTQPATLNSVSLTLAPLGTINAANPVKATNTYTAHTGTLNLSKTVSGDPVSATFGASKTYKFDINCPDAGFRQTVDLTLNATGTNTLQGNASVANVPTGRACTITPLTGLSPEQQKTVNFDGRVLNFDSSTNVQANSYGAYPFMLPDYPSGGTPTVSNINIDAKYSWKTSNVSVIKQLSGPAANLAAKEFTSFPVQYACQVPGDTSSHLAGTLNITTDQTKPAQIPNVRVNSECKVWESGAPDGVNVSLDKTTLVGSDANDNATYLDNAQAQTTKILTVLDTTDAGQNRVVVTNHFINRLGTVNLAKLVDTGGVSSGLPSTYTLGFDCGFRSIETSSGIQAIPLKGSLTLTAGGNGNLVLNSGDSAVDSKINTGTGGAMAVPYGNTCSFSEVQPTITATGIQWTTNVDSQKVQIGSETNSVTVTNTYKAAGDGLTIQRNVTSNAQMSGPLNYTMTCTNNDTALTLPNNGKFSLDNGDSVTFPPAAIPQGSNCVLKADTYGEAERLRTVNGVTFPVEWTWRVEFPTVGGMKTTNSGTSETGVLTADPIVVGSNSVVSISNTYDYVKSNFTANKSVEFPTHPELISEERKQVKRNRSFGVSFVCTAPYGDVSNESGTIVAGATDAEKRSFISADVAVGSKCTVKEDISQTATGIDIVQEVSINGGARQDATGAKEALATLQVDKDSNNNDILFINSYTRRTATLELNKIANTPIDLAKYEPQFHVHNFTMTCRDPLVETKPIIPGPGPNGTFTGQIQGVGQLSVDNVPVGAECTVVGDQFGRLDLYDGTDPNTRLETHLRPSSVDWALVRNDASTHRDDQLVNDTTTSMAFDIIDGNNVINLTNNYEWVGANLAFSKSITASKVAWDLFDQSKSLTMDFNYRCQGAGYSTSSIGTELKPSPANPLPTTLTYADFVNANVSSVTNPDGTITRTFTRDDLVVPSGALCDFTEVDVLNAPQVLKNDITVNGQQSSTLSQRIIENSDPIQRFDFANRFTRQMIPVRMVTLIDGFLDGVSPNGYTMHAVCDDGAKTTVEVNLSLDQSQTTVSTADADAPVGGQIVQLPAGATCTLSVSGDSLAALPTLETTAGSRTPFMVFGTWTSGTAGENNPENPPAGMSPSSVTADMKTYQSSFQTPVTAEPTSNGEVMTVAAEIIYPQDRVDVTFEKRARGVDTGNATFTFQSNCIEAQEFSLTSGQKITFPGVPVTKYCSVAETGDGLDNISPVLTVESSGDRLQVAEAVNYFGDDTRPEFHLINFEVLPVSTAEDLRTGGVPWTLVATNSYPQLEISKHIKGSPISSVTGAIADTALIPHTQDFMEFTYTVKNPGAVDFTALALKEPGLANKTVVVNGTDITIDADGTIPTSVCAMVGAELKAGAEQTCTFKVKITEPNDQNYTYDKTSGTVTVTAASAAGVITATDAYGAFRPMASVAWLLPETGVQTLVWVLVLGGLVLAYGVYRWKREREEDDEQS